MVRACPECLSTYVTETEFCGIDGARLVATATDPLIGQDVERYRIVERIGTGSMAAVYRARHGRLDRDFAIKVLFGEFASNRMIVARFEREAKTLSRFRHSHIVSVVDFGTTAKGLTYLVMDYLEGAPLSEALAKEAPFSYDRAARIASEIASALAEVHRHGVVHRDIKPANVMLTREVDREMVKLLDFGVVALGESDDEMKLTANGRLVGTPIYMAPEQGRAGLVTAQADLYALGVILYHMLAGRPPFVGDALADVLMKHSFEPPPALPDCLGLETLTSSLLKKEPENRPQSARAVMDEIDRWTREKSATAAQRQLGRTRGAPGVANMSARPAEPAPSEYGSELLAPAALGAMSSTAGNEVEASTDSFVLHGKNKRAKLALAGSAIVGLVLLFFWAIGAERGRQSHKDEGLVVTGTVTTLAPSNPNSALPVAPR